MSYKILIDNNLSVFLKEVLEENFPGTRHVSDLNLAKASDSEVWETGKREYQAILTKDRDFYYQGIMKGAPPKVIWITRGNCRNREMFSLVRSNLSVIKEFLESDQTILIIQ